MKLVCKILLLLILSSCSKEELKDNVIECNCTKTSYRKVESIVSNNGLPSLRVRNVVTNVERNIGCFPEITISTSEKTFQVIECID